MALFPIHNETTETLKFLVDKLDLSLDLYDLPLFPKKFFMVTGAISCLTLQALVNFDGEY